MAIHVDIRVGTAGWSIPRAAASRFATAGTHLQRYARFFHCAEIDSSFHRPHRAATYARWRDSTPPGFRFAAKLPRSITHEGKLRNARPYMMEFLDQTTGLGEKRGPILVQLPPSLFFDRVIVSAFFEMVRRLYEGPMVCEPRHPTWFEPSVSVLLDQYRVSRVAADPPPVPDAFVPAGWSKLAYFRWHGSPRTYWSRYDGDSIATLAAAVRRVPVAEEIWCVFDNTASGAAIDNAWDLQECVNPRQA
jgi:uncharacterized protein YecE (DUF72 family)